jgi:hypothetical protein
MSRPSLMECCTMRWRQGRSHITRGGISVTPGKLKTNRIKGNRSTKSHPEKFLCYLLESELWIGLWFIKNACWNFFYTDKLMGFNPLRYSIWLGLHPEKIPGSAPGWRTCGSGMDRAMHPVVLSKVHDTFIYIHSQSISFNFFSGIADFSGCSRARATAGTKAMM